MRLQRIVMDKFVRIVQKYRYLSELGEHIIQHRNMIQNYPPSTSCSYIRHIEQENRIHEFIQISESLHKEWEKNDQSINRYWTGLS